MSSVMIHKIATRVPRQLMLQSVIKTEKWSEVYLNDNQGICISGLKNVLLCFMQCCVNPVQISEVPKFFVESSSETTHATLLMQPTLK